jgi:hypothetical protein
VHVEDATRPRDELDRADASFELFENARCQTDSVRPRASGNAVLDADDWAGGHERMLAADEQREAAVDDQRLAADHVGLCGAEERDCAGDVVR